jgi:WD40 repeat protein
VAFSPRGDYLAAACPSNNSIQVWSTTHPGKSLHTLTLPKGNIPISAAFSPDNALLAVTSDALSGAPDGNVTTGTVQEWQISPFRQTIERSASNGDPYFTLAFSSRGEYLAVDGDMTTLLLNPATLEPAAPPVVGTSSAFSPDELVIAIEGANGIALRDVGTGQTVNTLPVPLGFGASYQIVPMAFSSDGKKLAAITGPDSDDIELWNVPYLATDLQETAAYVCGKLGDQPLPRALWEKYAPGTPYNNQQCPDLRESVAAAARPLD